MLKFVFLLVITILYAAVRHSDDFTIPVGNGDILIQDVAFNPARRFPELTFALRNGSSSPWWVNLEFVIAGSCNGKPKQWFASVSETLGWMGDRMYLASSMSEEERGRATSSVKHLTVLMPVETELTGCKTTGIIARLSSAWKAERN